MIWPGREGDGGQRSELRGQRSELRGQRSEVGGRRSEVGGRRSEVGGQRSENIERRTPNAQRPTPNAQRPTSNAQRSTLNAEHRTLNVEHPTSNAQGGLWKGGLAAGGGGITIAGNSPSGVRCSSFCGRLFLKDTSHERKIPFCLHAVALRPRRVRGRQIPAHKRRNNPRLEQPSRARRRRDVVGQPNQGWIRHRARHSHLVQNGSSARDRFQYPVRETRAGQPLFRQDDSRQIRGARGYCGWERKHIPRYICQR